MLNWAGAPVGESRAATLAGDPASQPPTQALSGVRPSSSQAAPSERSLSRALVVEARPKQWVKNVLVFAAPAAAGLLAHPVVITRTLLAFVALCLAASGTYFLNDVADAEADRVHPTKRARPVAAGEIDPLGAALIGFGLISAGLTVASTVDLRLLEVLGVYAALTLSYTRWLKHEPVIDIAVVAAGFVLRALAGAVATRVAVSSWFLIVVAAGSLFMVSGKRFAELRELGEGPRATRPSLARYSTAYLAYVWMLASSVAMVGYCLWAFEAGGADAGFPWYKLSIVPFVLGVLRYALLVDAGRGGAPEDLVLGDRVLQVIGLSWVMVFAAAVYLGAV